MPHDELLRMLGTTGDPEQDLSTNGDGTARFAGKYKTYIGVARVGGDVTGTSPSLVLTVNESANGTSSFSNVATFAAITDEQVGHVASTAPNYAVPGDDPLLVSFTTSKDYVRVSWTMTGTTPVFNDVSVELKPVATAAFRRSGI